MKSIFPPMPSEFRLLTSEFSDANIVSMRRRGGDNKGKGGQRSRSNRGRNDERRYKRDRSRESSPEYVESGQTPLQAKAARELLLGIGVPEPRPFEPDDFQI